jgi:hypothetical protein
MSERIVIHTVHGGLDRGLLKGCYFEPTEVPGQYNFYQNGAKPTDKPLAERVSQSSTFHFKLGMWEWTVEGRNFLISNTAAFGDWHNNDKGPNHDEGDGESGTFTAQAGLGSDSEDEAASSATA